MDENNAIQLTQQDGEILVDSRIVAKGIGIRHQTLLETIYTYQTELEEFGLLRFETEVMGRGQPQKYVMLNRNQAGIAISFSRNTKEVVRFKVGLFKAIDAMEQLILRQQQELAGIYQPTQSAQTQLPAAPFKTVEEALHAEPRCPCPTSEQMKSILVSTVQRLQPFFRPGITGAILIKYSEAIQSYEHIHGCSGLVKLTESLTEQNILTRSEHDGAYYYVVPQVAGYLQ